jgi:ATP-binding cassette subfamily F protein 3
MPIVTLNNIEKTFGRRVIFDQLNFIIDRGERVGLIGDNGAGKTTLFRMVTGEVTPDTGSVSIAKSLKVGHLSQDPTFEPGNTVIDEAELAFARLHELSHHLRELEHHMGEVTGDELDKALKEYQDAQHEFDLAGGYAWQHKLEATLPGVGLDRNTWEQPVATLSGGQRSRLALAKLLISEPDVLLLDEPTNHLDLAAIDWLEKYLLDFSGAVWLISRDRYLLDRLATRIVWLTRSQLSSYPGNYSAFVQQREIQELAQRRQYELQQADIAKQQEFIRRFGAGQRSKEAKGREKRLNRLLASDDMIAAVETGKKIRLSINTDQRAGDRVLSVRGLSKSFGDDKRLWTDVSFEIKRGERIGIIGPNGSGKTTMLKVLLGQEDADAGEVKWGANLGVGYYDQRLEITDPDNSVWDETRGEREVRDADLRAVLALMLFRNEDVEKPVGLLSGGERARIAMAQLLLDKPNVLLLDEPTNHLDIASSDALENALRQFEGTTLCVSHDRYFIDRTVGRLLIISPPDVRDFSGNYTAWTAKQAERAAAEAEEAAAKKHGKPKAKSAPPPPKAAPAKSKRADNPWARPFGRLSTQDLERQITETEIAIAECQGQFGAGGSFKDPKQGQKLKQEYESLSKKLKGLEEEYYGRQA